MFESFSFLASWSLFSIVMTWYFCHSGRCVVVFHSGFFFFFFFFLFFWYVRCFFFLWIFFFFFSYGLSRALPAACGSSQARGWIGAAAAALTRATAMPDLNCICAPHHSLWQHRILNSLSRASDRTCVLLDTSLVYYHWAAIGTSHNHLVVILIWISLMASGYIECFLIWCYVRYMDFRCFLW